ncbi:MAG TPA: PQQ-binding-like beta-propeller repeat protein [Actinomycetota bacterium]|nr:PQQ-binding-like beta-propeller repeat protein [Actinomycetota bacterium]
MAFVPMSMLAGRALGQAAEPGSAFAWPQYQGGPSHPGMADGPPPPYRQSWAVPVAPVGQQGASAPVVAADEAIVVGPATVYGIDLSTGQERWTLARAEGPSTTPAVASVKGTAVLLFTEGSSSSDAKLRAVELADRTPAWASPFAIGEQSHSGVTVAGGTAFVGDDAGHVFAVDLATGKELWSVLLNDGVQGPLTVADGTVYTVPQGRLEIGAAATPTGTPTPSPSPSPSGQVIGEENRLSLVALSASSGEPSWVVPLPAGTFFSSLPIAVGDSVYVAVSDGAFNGELLAVNAADGAVRWVHRGVGPVWQTSSPTAAGGAVYVADGRGGVWKFDPADGRRLFDFQFNEFIRRSSPVVVGGTALVGVGDGRLVAVDASSGHEVWESRTGPGLVGGIAVAGELVLAATGGLRGGVVAFEPDPQGDLIDVTSPSVADPPRLVGNFVIALAVMAVLIAVPLGYVSRRAKAPDFGEPAGPGDGDEGGNEDGTG